MIVIKLIVNEDSGFQCDYKKCKRLPQYFDQILNTFFIKKGVTCLWISTSMRDLDASELYCRDCIDMFYQEYKPILDSKLWAFK